MGQDERLPPATLVIWKPLIYFDIFDQQKNIFTESFGQIPFDLTLACIHRYVVY